MKSTISLACRIVTLITHEGERTKIVHAHCLVPGQLKENLVCHPF